jgi:hypothetical protein
MRRSATTGRRRAVQRQGLGYSRGTDALYYVASLP